MYSSNVSGTNDIKEWNGEKSVPPVGQADLFGDKILGDFSKNSNFEIYLAILILLLALDSSCLM